MKNMHIYNYTILPQLFGLDSVTHTGNVLSCPCCHVKTGEETLKVKQRRTGGIWDFVSVAFSSSCNELLRSHSVMAFIFTHYPSKCWLQIICIVLAHARWMMIMLNVSKETFPVRAALSYCRRVCKRQCFHILLFSDWLPWYYSPFIWFFYLVCIGTPSPLATADVW